MNREEHMQWCKDRALAELDAGGLNAAFTSMLSDLSKHSETKDHPAIELGMALLLTGRLNNDYDMRNFIEGFA